MTVSSTTNRVTYAGNGATTVFAFPYFFVGASDLLVTKTIVATGAITTTVITTDYTVSGTQAANLTFPSGGSVTMIVAPATGTTLSIVRVPAQTQATHWVDNDPDSAAVKELAFDKLTLLVQRLADLVSRSLSLKDGYANSFDPTLPPIIPASAYLASNSLGTALQWITAAPSIQLSGSRATPLNIVAASGITPVDLVTQQTMYIQGNAGPVVITANPKIAPVTYIGMRLRLICVSASKTVEIDDGTGVLLNGNFVMGLNDVLDLEWDGSNWFETGRKEH